MVDTSTWDTQWVVWINDHPTFVTRTKSTAYGLLRRAWKDYGYEGYVTLAPECFVPDTTKVRVVDR